MKILLTTLNAKFIHSSLALAYLKAYCQSDFTDIQIREYTINEPTTNILADIYSCQPDVICFSCYIWNIEMIKILCADLKQIMPTVTIIAGGPEVSYDAETFLNENPAIYCVVRGEGEAAMLELLHCIRKQSRPENILGITYREDSIIVNADRPLIGDLDTIPFPYENELIHYRNRTVYYETSRGCPFHCSYCLSSTIKGVRYFSLQRVKRDLKYLMDNHLPEVKLVDRTFNADEKRAKEIMAFIIRHNHITKFHCEIDAALLSPDMLLFLGEVPAGMFDFEIGIQSTFPTALAAVNRERNWQKQSRNIAQLKQYGNIHIHLDLIAGLPYEDYQRFKTSFNQVYDLKPDVIQLGFLKLLKGSLLRDQSQEYGYKFEQKPPYQVLGNHYISYPELMKLSQIEDLISRYYNTGMVSNFLNYTIAHCYQGDSFAFWERLSAFLSERNFFRFGHKREEEYTLLYEFIRQEQGADRHLAELLKFDYLLNNRERNLPAVFTSHNPAYVNEVLYACLKDQSFIARMLPDSVGKSPREIRRLVHLEYLFLDGTGKPSAEPVPLLFIYKTPGKKAETARITLDEPMDKW